MLRISEPGSEFVRLLTKTVVLPPPATPVSTAQGADTTTQPPVSAAPLAAAPSSTASTSNAGADAGADAVADADADAAGSSVVAAAGDGSSHTAQQQQQVQEENKAAGTGATVAGQPAQAADLQPALSPADVAGVLSPQAGCEVLQEEESHWLLVSDTFSPGDIWR